MTVGVLALQGCIEPHLEMLKRMGVEAIRVRSVDELSKVDRLIMPGGESTAMLKLIDSGQLFEPLQEFAKTKPVWGICAGAILCSHEVVHPEQRSLDVINIRAHRNFYGSQLDSFKTKLSVSVLKQPLEVDFIRAPKLEPLDNSVEILAKAADGTPVLMQQGLRMVSAFHSELGTDSGLHEYFLRLA